MKLKGIELKGTYKVRFEDTWLVVYDDKGNKIYIEFSDGGWKKESLMKKAKKFIMKLMEAIGLKKNTMTKVISFT